MFTKRFTRGAAKIAALALLAFGMAACSSSGGGSSTPPPPPPTGVLTVNVTQAGAATKIPGARVTVIDGDTGDILNVLTTDELNGTASVTVPNGQVLLKISAQGYETSPSSIGSPMPYLIQGGKTTLANIELTALANPETLSFISGMVMDGTTGIANALVVASDGINWYSTASGPDGTYTLFNLSAGTFTVSALRGGYNFTDAPPALVAATGPTVDVNVYSAGAAIGTISGSVTFVRTKNGVVDVTLIDPETNEVIPGLRVYTDATNRTYTLRNVPEGTFIAIASLANDDYVLDPDSVAKLGLPIVEVINGEAYPYYSPVPDDLSFNITGAVMLTQPVNFQTLPANALVFTWDTTSSYSSAQDFTVEVTDESGNWVWGEKNPALTAPYTSLTATCDAALEEGKFYRVQVYANTKNNDGTYTVTSTSEDLEGIFKVGPNQ